MPQVVVLVQGYARKEKSGWRASSASVLIKDSGLNILVDPGANAALLLSALTREKFEPADINLIFLTHYHPDHILNIRLFPEADIVDGNTIYHGDEEIGFGDKIPNTNIRVIPTPGHADEHACLLAESDKGRIAIAGDLFWWEDGQKQKTDYQGLLNRDDSFAKNKEQLLASRKKILAMADYIIPGHGKQFNNRKSPL